MRRFLLIGGTACLLALGSGARAAVLRESAGLVQVRAPGSERWRPAGKTPLTMAPGTAVRTGFNAAAVVVLDGGATWEAAGNTQFSVEEIPHGGSAVNLLFGSARVVARALGGRVLEVRTPTATARARSDSSSWRTAVGGGGNALVEVVDGLVAVEDSRGGAMRLRGGERIEADLAGLHEPTLVPTVARVRRDDFLHAMRREMALDLEADEAQRVAAGELRRQEFESGRALTDASGARVRAEEFVVRTSPSSFQFVALNGRRGSGLSWFSWRGDFDRALPTDLSGVFAILPGSAGGAAPWTLTAYTATRSNGVDRVVETGTGGHQVDLNGNADPTDDLTTMFDPVTDGFVSVANRPAFVVLFDNGTKTVNGVAKGDGWTGTNIQSQADRTFIDAPTTNTTYPDPNGVRQDVFSSYSDGSSLTVVNRAVSAGGGVVGRSAFGPALSGPAWQSGLLRSAFQQTVTASEFGGRSINLMLSPRVLIGTGALP